MISSKTGTEFSFASKVIAKVLEVFSPSLAARYAMNLFFTPIKFTMPERERIMDENSRQYKMVVPSIDKEILVYEYGDAPEKILLVHGWCGRGTQLVTMASHLKDLGYGIISFDAPGHGKSPDSTAELYQFVKCIQEVSTHYPKFKAIIGHSLGAMASVNAVRYGVETDALIIISGGDLIKDITVEFALKLGMDSSIVPIMLQMMSEKLGEAINSYSTSIAVKKIDVPILIIHDKDDVDVPYQVAFNIQRSAKNAELMITEGYRHRKILAADEVIDRISNFIAQHKK